MFISYLSHPRSIFSLLSSLWFHYWNIRWSIYVAIIWLCVPLLLLLWHLYLEHKRIRDIPFLAPHNHQSSWYKSVGWVHSHGENARAQCLQKLAYLGLHLVIMLFRSGSSFTHRFGSQWAQGSGWKLDGQNVTSSLWVGSFSWHFGKQREFSVISFLTMKCHWRKTLPPWWGKCQGVLVGADTGAVISCQLNDTCCILLDACVRQPAVMWRNTQCYGLLLGFWMR